MANGFNSSNRARMGSNAVTDQKQGGGPSKAGFPYQVGRDSWSSLAINGCSAKGGSCFKGGCATLKCLQFTANPNVRELRPTFVRPNIHMR
jgi:hypothetical protein